MSLSYSLYLLSPSLPHSQEGRSSRSLYESAYRGIYCSLCWSDAVHGTCATINILYDWNLLLNTLTDCCVFLGSGCIGQQRFSPVHEPSHNAAACSNSQGNAKLGKPRTRSVHLKSHAVFKTSKVLLTPTRSSFPCGVTSEPEPTVGRGELARWADKRRCQHVNLNPGVVLVRRCGPLQL